IAYVERNGGQGCAVDLGQPFDGGGHIAALVFAALRIAAHPVEKILGRGQPHRAWWVDDGPCQDPCQELDWPRWCKAIDGHDGIEFGGHDMTSLVPNGRCWGKRSGYTKKISHRCTCSARTRPSCGPASGTPTATARPT